MRLEGRTVLITGGGSGLGLALAGALLKRGNQVIAVGRSKPKLEQAAAANPGLVTRPCDVSKREELEALAAWVTREHPKLDVLVNNAGTLTNWDIAAEPAALDKPLQEIAINLSAPILLSALLVPHLCKQPEAGILNVSSGSLYVPTADAPIYGATKAALHSFTQALRYQLRETKVKVVEIIPPTVVTEMSKGRFKDAPKMAQPISIEQFLTEALRGLERGQPEIHIGMTGMIRLLTRLAPGTAAKQGLAAKSARTE